MISSYKFTENESEIALEMRKIALCTRAVGYMFLLKETCVGVTKILLRYFRIFMTPLIFQRIW